MHREPKLLNDNGVTIWSVCGRDKRIPPPKANSANGRDALVASNGVIGIARHFVGKIGFMA